MSEENVTPEVESQLDEAEGAHQQAAAGAEAWGGEGNQPEGTGFAPPDTGQGEQAESEIPVGVDQIEAQAPAADDDEGGSAPVDLADIDAGDGDAAGDAEAGGEAEAGGDAEAGGEAEAGGDEPAAEGEAAAE
ncbi:MAG: hypothetical protein QOE11_2825 [Solirubrobacteraceae bacterium]|jgi:hypothetical protein|nr:hypothetical protein [Solirubrobacteraceae bacterium]